MNKWYLQALRFHVYGALFGSLLFCACSSVADFKVEVGRFPAGSTKLAAIAWRSVPMDMGGSAEKLILSQEQPNLAFDVPGDPNDLSRIFSFGISVPSRDTSYTITVGAFSPHQTVSNLFCLRATSVTGEAAGFNILDSVTAVLSTPALPNTIADNCIPDLSVPSAPIIANITLEIGRLENDTFQVAQVVVGGWNFDPQATVQVTLEQPLVVNGSKLTPLPPSRASIPNATQIVLSYQNKDLPSLQTAKSKLHIIVTNSADPNQPGSMPLVSKEFVSGFGN